MFWLAVILAFAAMGYNEKNGHWPLIESKNVKSRGSESESESSVGSRNANFTFPKKSAGNEGNSMTDVQS